MAAASVWLQLQLLPPHRLHSTPLLSLPSNHSSSACHPVYKYRCKEHAAAGRGNLLLCRAAGASSSVATKEQEGAASDPSSEEGSSEPEIYYSYKDDPNFRGCKGCGRDEVERGCNGEGRIQGGIAAVPGFGWWPIKAYRPCPGFVASGGRYRRQGQSMDDVASGRGKKKPSPAKNKRWKTTTMAKHQSPIPMPLSLALVLVALLLPAARGAGETPQYTTVHAESDFEVRLYSDTVWMSAPTPDIPSFHVATKLGFHRLFQYLMGANLNSSRIRMTTPVLTSVVPDAGPLHSSAFFVRFYLPTKFQASPPVPLPELNLQADRWPSHCIAVRSFSGYARDKNVVEEAEKLAMSLSRSPWANSTNYPSESAYSVAQYSSPFRIIGRVNEVWFDVDCKSTGVETY